jgi:hypothetical protein
MNDVPSRSISYFVAIAAVYFFAFGVDFFLSFLVSLLRYSFFKKKRPGEVGGEQKNILDCIKSPELMISVAERSDEMRIMLEENKNKRQTKIGLLSERGKGPCLLLNEKLWVFSLHTPLSPSPSSERKSHEVRGAIPTTFFS